MAILQFRHDLLPVDAIFCHQNRGMVQEIRHLIDDFLGTGIFGGNQNFRSFLSDFFQDLIQPFVEQIVCVRTLFRMELAVCDGVIQFF